jgi:hypothetical protein
VQYVVIYALILNAVITSLHAFCAGLFDVGDGIDLAYVVVFLQQQNTVKQLAGKRKKLEHDVNVTSYGTEYGLDRDL